MHRDVGRFPSEQSIMHQVYIIVSLSSPSRFYIGYSTDARERLAQHNNGKNPSTARFGPWKLGAVICLPEKQRALDLERYLKGGSGRAFLSRHLI
jgi:predicted GIY-YIG superfamily endonuclease